MRRRKVTTSVVVPLMLVALASAGFWALRRGGEQASSVEREPNDSPTQATLLPLDVRVRGKIGSRQKGGEPDMDYFRVPAGKGPRVVSARVEGIPTVDLVLELFDGQGTALGKSDAHGDGGTEWLQPTSIGPAEAYLLVRQVWIQGSPLKENVPDPYRLSVHWGRLRPGWEVEPNDWREQATAVPAGSAVKGYLGHANDKDWFSVAPNETGQLLVRLTAPEGVDIVVTTGDAPAGSRGVTVRADKPGELKIPVKAMEPVVVGLSRKLPPGPGGKSDDAKSDKLGGLDSPYELRLESRSAP